MDHVRRTFASHPSPASDAGDEAFALVQAAASCAAATTTCADACLEETDPAALRRCIRMCQDASDLCVATGRLVARPGKQDPGVLRAMLETCALACRTCAEECRRHSPRMKHCAVCAEACTACAAACDQMQAAIVA